MKVNESDLRNFFTQIGKVNSVIMIRDKHTGRHKGIGYVEMVKVLFDQMQFQFVVIFMFST